MLGMVGVLTAAICTSCVDEQNPTGLRLGVPQPTVELKLSDGCARFQVRFDAGGAPIIEPIYNTGSCGLNELRLLSDTAGSFDPATGTLRVAVVMENIGTTAVIPDVRLFFNADSVKRFDAQGEPVPGTPDILAYQPDSVESGGRRARWFWDAWLAPAGQPQVLQPGGRTERRWVEFRGTGWTERVRLKLFAWGAKQSAVPAVPPDTAPAWIFADSNVVTNDSLVSGSFLKRVLGVEFLPQATQAEKAAAIAAVSGVVIGGTRWSPTEGYYYLLLPSGSTTSSLLQAIATLKSLSQVVVAELVIVRITKPEYRKPLDGQSWRQWNLQHDSIVTRRTPLERLRAPLAWGCSVGNDSTAVAVVDADARPNGDMIYNGTFSQGIGVTPFPNAPEHGTSVASIIAARGNTGSGMVGIAWKSDLRFYEYAPLDTATNVNTILARIRKAVRDGARVVNFSSAISASWGTRAPGTRSDSQIVNRVRALTSAMLARLKTEGFDPLLIVPAGDFFGPTQRNAYWAGYAASKIDHPTNILVVGSASTSPGVLTASSGRGGLVTVAAVGESVYGLDASNPEGRPRSGVSYATPQVTGVVALLLAFDSRLTAAELIQLVEAGAIAGGQFAGGIPYLDAYAALRKAAERSGAPLCGNRVWTASDRIVVQRSVGNANPVDEVLADSLPILSRVNVFHGGRRVQNNIPSDTTGALIWNPNGTWTASSNLPLDPESGGTFWSLGGTDHDLTMFLDTKISADVVTSSLYQLPNFNQTGSIVIGTYDEGADPSTALCIRMHGTTCETYTYTNRYVDPVDAIAPEGDRGFVAVNHWAQTPTITSWSACTDDPTEQCANVDLAVAPVGPTQIFELDLVNRTRTARWTVNAYVRWLAVSERNDEVVAAEELGATCSLVYRDVKRPSVSGSALRTIPQALNYCSFPGTATIAPRVSTPFGRR